MSFRVISPSDKSASDGSWSNEAVRVGDGMIAFDWKGWVKLKAGTAANTFPIYRFDPQRGVAPKTALVIPANSFITKMGFFFCDPSNVDKTFTVTNATSAGKIKLASGITVNTSGLFCNSAAASSGTHAHIPFTAPARQVNITPVTVGSSDITLRLFGSDGNATEGSAALSNLTVTVDTLIAVFVSGVFAENPHPDSFQLSPPDVNW